MLYVSVLVVTIAREPCVLIWGTVCLPNDAQWLSSRLLRPHTDHPEFARPDALTLEHARSQCQGDAILTRQHCFRCLVRYSRRLPGISLLSRQDPPPILLAIPTRRHSASIPQRSRRHETNIRRRRHSRSLERCWSRHGTNRLWIISAITHILLREEVTAKKFRYQGWYTVTSHVLFRFRVRGLLCHASSRHRHEQNVQPNGKSVLGSL